MNLSMEQIVKQKVNNEDALTCLQTTTQHSKIQKNKNNACNNRLKGAKS